jgi:autotransporter-associated beta strand protein
MMDFGAIALSGFGGGSGRNISVAAGAAVRRNTLDNAFLNRLVETSSEITVMTGTTANNLNFSASAGANLPNAFLGNWVGNGAKAEYSGIFTPTADAYRFGSPTSSGLLGIVSAMTGTQGLIVGGNRVELVNSGNSFSGDTFIRNGARLYLGNNLALQNSAFDTGVVSNTGTFGLSDGALSGRTTGSIASPSPVFGGLKGSRNLLTAYNGTSPGNNAQLLAATAVTGFTLNPGSGQAHSYSGAIADFASGTTLTKTGLGTQILAGANTYTGATNINTGKLFINGSLSNVAVALNVSSGATLGGTGTIGRNVTVAAGGKLEFNLSTAAASHDHLDISTGRSFGFSGTSELIITSTSGASPGVYTLVTGGNNIAGVAPATLNLPSGWSATVSISGNSLLLNITSTSLTAGSLAVTAAGGLTSSGFVGGPFSPDSVVYTLTNPGQTSINWTAAKTAPWVNISAASGTLAAGANTTVTVSSNTTADSLGAGFYSDTVTFSNTTNATGDTTRGVALTVISAYQGWASGFLSAEVGNPVGNNDGDTLTNLQEYAFGTDPTASSVAPIAYAPGGDVTSPGSPTLLNLAVGGGVDFHAVFGRRKIPLAHGLTYSVQFSADLTNWVTSTEAPSVLTGENSTGHIEAVSVPFPDHVPTANGDQKPTFFRVGVTGN